MRSYKNMFHSKPEKTHISLCVSCLRWTCVVFEILFNFLTVYLKLDTISCAVNNFKHNHLDF
jgi:hypothetical protein